MAKSASAGTHQKFTKTRGKQRNKQTNKQTNKQKTSKQKDLAYPLMFILLLLNNCIVKVLTFIINLGRIK